MGDIHDYDHDKGDDNIDVDCRDLKFLMMRKMMMEMMMRITLRRLNRGERLLSNFHQQLPRVCIIMMKMTTLLMMINLFSMSYNVSHLCSQSMGTPGLQMQVALITHQRHYSLHIIIILCVGTGSGKTLAWICDQMDIGTNCCHINFELPKI